MYPAKHPFGKKKKKKISIFFFLFLFCRLFFLWFSLKNVRGGRGAELAGRARRSSLRMYIRSSIKGNGTKKKKKGTENFFQGVRLVLCISLTPPHKKNGKKGGGVGCCGRRSVKTWCFQPSSLSLFFSISFLSPRHRHAGRSKSVCGGRVGGLERFVL